MMDSCWTRGPNLHNCALCTWRAATRIVTNSVGHALVCEQCYPLTQPVKVKDPEPPEEDIAFARKIMKLIDERIERLM